jgi:hypothetical protein
MRILISLIILLGLGTQVMAQPPGDPLAAGSGETITGIVAFEGAVVYSGPDFAYRIVGELPLNGSVTVIGRRGDFFYRWDGQQWLEIAFEGSTAWVYARLIRTSVPFNSIPPTGRPLPRNRDGRVPDVFELTDDICDSWFGTFAQSGDILSRTSDIVVTFPEMPGANIYSVIVIAPSGLRTAFDSETTTATIIDRELRSHSEYGQYVWRVAPYWTFTTGRRNWQQLCLLETGGTFTRVRP